MINIQLDRSLNIYVRLLEELDSPNPRMKYWQSRKEMKDGELWESVLYQE